jgi:hypothetical protein
MAGLRQLQQDIGRLFTPADKARILKAALEKAIQPALLALKESTPLGPTGNLRRAIATKVVAYVNDGAAVALLGFRRAGASRSESAAGGTVRKGSDRAFHQWWLEEGTAPRQVSKLSNTPYIRKSHSRKTKSGDIVTVREHMVSGQNAYIASSFNRLGPFKMLPTPRPTGGQKQLVQTDPGYQNAFFKKSSTPIVIPAMKPGGSGEPPLKTAWARTQSTVAEILQRELRLTLEQALDTLSQSSTGTIVT